MANTINKLKVHSDPAGKLVRQMSLQSLMFPDHILVWLATLNQIKKYIRKKIAYNNAFGYFSATWMNIGNAFPP